MTATQLYDTAAAQLYEFAKGNISFGNTNQKEFEFLTSRIPDSSKTPKAMARMLDRFEKKIERKMAKNESLISKMPDYSQGLETRQNGAMQQEQQQRTFKVKTPNGEIVLVPESDIDEAVSRGGMVVQ